MATSDYLKIKAAQEKAIEEEKKAKERLLGQKQTETIDDQAQNEISLEVNKDKSSVSESKAKTQQTSANKRSSATKKSTRKEKVSATNKSNNRDYRCGAAVRLNIELDSKINKELEDYISNRKYNDGITLSKREVTERALMAYLES